MENQETWRNTVVEPVKAFDMVENAHVVEEKVEEQIVPTVDVPTRIEFNYNGSRFVLEFDRESAMRAEKGFDLSIDEVTSGKAYVIQSVFTAAFLKHHPHVKTHVVEGLWDKLENKLELYQTLASMYVMAATSILDEPSTGNAIGWKKA